MNKIRKIEVDFPVEVDLPDGFIQDLDELLTKVCKLYKRQHPDRTMWVFGVGQKMMINPMLIEDDKPIPFDDKILHFEIYEREK